MLLSCFAVTMRCCKKEQGKRLRVFIRKGLRSGAFGSLKFTQQSRRIVTEYVAPLLVFALLALCSHAVFLPQFFGDPFIAFTYVGGDATSQMIPAISLLENALLSGDLFWSWNYGLGGDLYSEFAYYYSTSPFFYVMFLVKCLFGAAGADFATTQAWRLVGSIVKQTLCMLFLYRLCRQEKRPALLSFLGAVLYGCSFWFIDNSFAFDFMTDAMLWPPLIIMAYNRFMRTNRPFALIVACALAIANSFYFGYMTVLFLVILALIFSLPVWEKGEGVGKASEGVGKAPEGVPEGAFAALAPAEAAGEDPGEATGEPCAKGGTKPRKNADSPFALYARRIGVLALIMLVALALAAVAFLPSVKAFLSADRVAQLVTMSPLPKLETLALLPEIFFLGYTPASAMDLQTFAFPLALLLVPFIRWRDASGDVRKITILAVIMLLLSISPAASSLFSGVSYPSNRWYFLVVFAVAYALPAWLETLLRQKRIKAPALVFVAVLLAASLISLDARWAFANVESGYEFPALTVEMTVHLALGCLFIVLLALSQRFRDQRAAKNVPLVLAIVAFCAAAVLIMPFGPLRALQSDCAHPGVQRYESYDQLNESFQGSAATQAAYAQLQPGENEFYRTYDAETTINRVYDGSEARVENRSWICGTYGTSAYNSMIPRSLSRVLKKSYAVTSTTLSASQYRGLGNRLFLENAWGVEYKLNTECDANTPLAGYEQVQLENGQTVWKNTNACGIDLWYNSVLPSDLAYQLTLGQRDALLLQTAVLENAEGCAQEYGIPVFQGESAALGSAHTVDLSSLAVTFEDCAFEGTAQECTLNAGGNSTVRIELPVVDGAYLFTFGTENPNLWGCSFFVNGTEYYLSAAESRWGYDQTTFCLAIPGNAETLEIKVPWGYFSLWECSLEVAPYDQFAAWTESVNAVNLENLVVDGPKVLGTVSADEAGVLAINAPYSSGWHCRIDGQEVDVLHVSELFPGVVVQPGQHQVEFYYVNKAFVVSAVISAITLAALVIAAIVSHRLRRWQR